MSSDPQPAASVPSPEPLSAVAPESDVPATRGGTPSTGGETIQPPPERPSLLDLPGCQVLEEIGHGGMGVVYKARQIKANRIVALKMILASRHASLEKKVRFQIEAEAIAGLVHHNIVQLHEAGENDVLPFFSLEFCGGGGLDARLKTWTPAPRKDAAHQTGSVTGGEREGKYLFCSPRSPTAQYRERTN